MLAASYGGERGHPVLLGRAAWPTVPDEGARSLVPVLVECDDLGAPGDVDYPEDLPERLRPRVSLSEASFAFSSGDISSLHAFLTSTRSSFSKV